MEESYQNGKRHGLAKGFYLSGLPYFEETYNNGNREGTKTMWAENTERTKILEETYANGLLTDLAKNGLLMAKRNRKYPTKTA